MPLPPLSKALSVDEDLLCEKSVKPFQGNVLGENNR